MEQVSMAVGSRSPLEVELGSNLRRNSEVSSATASCTEPKYFSDYAYSDQSHSHVISHRVDFDRDPLKGFSALTLDDHLNGVESLPSNPTNQEVSNYFTPQKSKNVESLEDRIESDLEAAIDSGNFPLLEDLGLKLALFARMGDLAGIKKLTANMGKFRDENGSFQGPSTSSTEFSTPDTVAAFPTEPVSPRLGTAEYFLRSPFSQRVSFSPFLTSVKTNSQGIISNRVLSGLSAVPTGDVSHQEIQVASNLISIIEPMMDTASVRVGNSGLTPVLRCGDLTGFKNGILAIADIAKRITSTEPRLLELPAPCYVLGDIHGNLADLNFFRRILWPAGMDVAAGDFLFLGDFVDRGLESLPVVAYVMAIKVLYPSKIWAIRGNHETREVNGNQMHYQDGSFLTQCLSTFGELDGRAVWDAVNNYFDTLPLAASIDGSVFCVHGGVPQELCEPAASLDLIRQVECPLRNAQDNKMVYDMLWSDPSTPEQERITGLDSLGFGHSPRGCRSFGEVAIETFLEKHRFQHVFRGHEAQKAGVGVSMSSRLTTIFSTSRDHFGPEVEATCGCVLVDKGLIHPVVRALLSEDAVPTSSNVYYLSPTPSNQSVEVTEVPLVHYYGARPMEHIHSAPEPMHQRPPPEPAPQHQLPAPQHQQLVHPLPPPPICYPQFIAAPHHPWAQAGWGPGIPPPPGMPPGAVLHHFHPSQGGPPPGAVHFIPMPPPMPPPNGRPLW